MLEMQSIFFGFLIAFLSISYLGFGRDGKIDSKTTIAVNLLGTVVGGIVLSIIFYLDLPAFVGLWWGWFNVAGIWILIGSAISLVVCMMVSDGHDYKGALIQVIKFLAVIATGLIIMFTPFNHATDLYKIPQVTDIDNISAPNGILDPINTKHVRLVDQDLAYSLAQNVIGGSRENYGSIYELVKGEMHIQTVKGHEFWVAPLEFQGYWAWSNKMTSPGFIMVDAEDPNVPAQLYTGYNMRYMPNAFWGDYLDRYVYASGYMNCQLEDFTFEVTDDLAPRWTVTKSRPTINNDGYVVDAVLEINPTNGKITEHPVGNVPAWIDRVTPERIALDYATWIGAYSKDWWNAYGYWNSIHENVNEVTTVDGNQEMFFVYGSDDKPYWFGGMTSTSYSDQSLTSIVLIDARNPTKMYRIKMTGANEQAALDIVNTAVSNYKDWHGTAIIPYNIYGVLTYIIPVDAKTNSGNVFKGVGFVDAMAKHVVFGETKEIASAAYKDYLATKDINIALTSENDRRNITGNVFRIGETTASGRTTYNIYLDNSDAIFSVNPTAYPAVTVTAVNDKVDITYVDTGDTVLEATGFNNENVKVRVGKDQIQLNKETAVLETQKDTNWEVQQNITKQLEQLRGN